MISVLSLGWGVQSWTLAAMAAMGDSKNPISLFTPTRHGSVNQPWTVEAAMYK